MNLVCVLRRIFYQNDDGVLVKFSQLQYAKINAKNVGWTQEMVSIFLT